MPARLLGERTTVQRALPWGLALVVIALPVSIIAVIAVTLWNAAWREAEHEIARSADAVAEYVLRVLDGHRVAADRINDLLENLSNEQIQAHERELHANLAKLLPDLPLVQTIAVLGADGLMLLTANVYPVPRDSYFKDREWVRDLKAPDAPRTHISKVNVGRLDANLFFGVSRRRVTTHRTGRADDYDGVINISVEPNKVAAGFADLINDSSDVVRLIRADGQVLARLPGFAAPPPPLSRDNSSSFFTHVAAGLERGTYVARLPFENVERLIAFRRLKEFPVFASVARELRHIIEQEVAPFAVRKPEDAQHAIVLDGPGVRVTATAAQALSMAFHELATNAAKYGAFAAPDGSVRVSWYNDPDRDALLLEWVERGGPTIHDVQTRVGFGTRLIDTTIEHQLNGKIARHWSATGLTIRAEIPLEHVVADAVIAQIKAQR